MPAAGSDRHEILHSAVNPNLRSLSLPSSNANDSSPSSSLTTRKAAKLLNCGFVSGLIQAFVFNPWDRALYLSVKNERAFLLRTNFEQPFAGVMQTVIQRAMSAGLYFPMEEIFMELLSNKTSLGAQPWTTLMAGTFAGSMNGILMNPFTRIKVNYIKTAQ